MYDGHTISEPAFGMFRFTGRESETTSQWELGVGDSETSVRLSRGRVEAEIDFPARDSLPRGVTRWCESAMAKVLEGATPSEPRSRRPDSGRQPRGSTTFGSPRAQTQPRSTDQPHRLEQKTTLPPSDIFHCNLVRRLVSDFGGLVLGPGPWPPNPLVLVASARSQCRLACWAINSESSTATKSCISKFLSHTWTG